MEQANYYRNVMHKENKHISIGWKHFEELGGSLCSGNVYCVSAAPLMGMHDFAKSILIQAANCQIFCLMDCSMWMTKHLKAEESAMKTIKEVLNTQLQQI